MMWIRCGGVALALAYLSGCANSGFLDTKADLQKNLASSVLHSTTPGYWVAPTTGAAFEPVQPLDSRDAIVYVYRPLNTWNRDELQTPSFFVNGQRVYGLKGQGYFWLELPAGQYYLMAKRPVSVLNLAIIFETKIRVVGGKAYYFRYDESKLQAGSSSEAVHDAQTGLLHAGPLQQVTESVAAPEISKTLLEEPGEFFDYDRGPIWAPFDLYAHAGNVRYGELQILDPDRGVHERYTPISHLDTSKVQNKVDASTHWMPDWLLHLFR